MNGLLYLALLVALGCASPRYSSFEQVRTGMEKDQVIELMGSPNSHRRVRDEDRWGYVFYKDDLREEKAIHFVKGRVVYIGEPIRPSPEVAAEIDRRNQLENEQVASEWEAAHAKTTRRDKAYYQALDDEYLKEMKRFKKPIPKR